MKNPKSFMNKSIKKIVNSRFILIFLAVLVSFVAFSPMHVLANMEEEQSDDVKFIEPLDDNSNNTDLDTSLTNFITINVYEKTDEGWVLVEEFTSEGENSEKLRLTGNHYHVNWHESGSWKDENIQAGKETAPGHLKESSESAKDYAPGQNTGPGDNSNGGVIKGEYIIETSVAGLVVDTLEVTFTKNNNKDKQDDSSVSLSDRGSIPIKFIISNDAVIRARVLTEQGLSASEIAQVLLAEFGLTAEQTAQLLYNEFHSASSVLTALKVNYGVNAEGGARILKDTGFPIEDIHGALRATWNYLTTTDIMTIFKDIGYYAPEIAGFLGSVLEWAAEPVADLLKSIGFPMDDIYNALEVSFDYLTTTDIVQIFKDIGYGAAEIAAFLKYQICIAAGPIAELLKLVGFPKEEIYTAINSAFDYLTTTDIMQIFKDIGFDASEIATFLKGFLGWAAAPAAELLKLLNFPMADINGALEVAFDYLTTTDIMQIFKDIGYYADDIADFLGNVMQWAAEPVANLLKDIGFPIQDIHGALKATWNYLTTTDIMTIFRDIGYSASDIADFLGNVLEWAAEPVADILRDLNFPIDKIYEAIDLTFDYLTTTDTMQIFKDIGFGFSEIAAFLKNFLGWSVNQVGQLLKDIGAGFDEIADIAVGLWNLSASVLSALLKDLGASAQVTGDLLKSIWDLSWEAIADILKLDFGFDEIEEYFEDIGETLKDWWNDWWDIWWPF